MRLADVIVVRPHAGRLYYYDSENEALPILEWLNNGPVSIARGAAANYGAANVKAFTGHLRPDAQHKGWLDLVGCAVEELNDNSQCGFKLTEETAHEAEPMEPLTLWCQDAEERAAWVDGVRLAARPTWLWVNGLRASGMLDTVYAGLSPHAGSDTADPRAQQCQVCTAAFGLFSRPSHCRRCGGVVCSKCANPGALRQLGYSEPQKQCRHCQAGRPASWFIEKLP